LVYFFSVIISLLLKVTREHTCAKKHQGTLQAAQQEYTAAATITTTTIKITVIVM
jgi:hypothetical protein